MGKTYLHNYNFLTSVKKNSWQQVTQKFVISLKQEIGCNKPLDLYIASHLNPSIPSKFFLLGVRHMTFLWFCVVYMGFLNIKCLTIRLNWIKNLLFQLTRWKFSPTFMRIILLYILYNIYVVKEVHVTIL